MSIKWRACQLRGHLIAENVLQASHAAGVWQGRAGRTGCRKAGGVVLWAGTDTSRMGGGGGAGAPESTSATSGQPSAAAMRRAAAGPPPPCSSPATTRPVGAARRRATSAASPAPPPPPADPPPQPAGGAAIAAASGRTARTLPRAATGCALPFLQDMEGPLRYAHEMATLAGGCAQLPAATGWTSAASPVIGWMSAASPVALGAAGIRRDRLGRYRGRLGRGVVVRVRRSGWTHLQQRRVAGAAALPARAGRRRRGR